MTLKIVGPGFGRTGTKSTKDALELLGFGPCHHMYEVFANPPQVDHWLDVFVGKPVNWEQVFDGYTSQIDWPGAHAWRDLATAFPDAKVLLTKRPEDSWHRSFSRTIGKRGKFMTTWTCRRISARCRTVCWRQWAARICGAPRRTRQGFWPRTAAVRQRFGLAEWHRIGCWCSMWLTDGNRCAHSWAYLCSRHTVSA